MRVSEHLTKDGSITGRSFKSSQAEEREKKSVSCTSLTREGAGAGAPRTASLPRRDIEMFSRFQKAFLQQYYFNNSMQYLVSFFIYGNKNYNSVVGE